MSDHDERLISTDNGQTNNAELVLPISSEDISRWTRLYSSLSYYASRENRSALRVYARRLITGNDGPVDNMVVNVSTEERNESPNNLMVTASPSSSWNALSDQVIVNTNHDDNNININMRTTGSSLPRNDSVVINIEVNGLSDERTGTSSSPLPPPLPLSNNEVSVLPLSHAPSDNGDMHVLHHPTTITTTAAAQPNTEVANSNTVESQSNEDEAALSINGESVNDILDRHPELAGLLKVLWQYFIFLLIILIKVTYDRFFSFLLLSIVLCVFLIGNKVSIMTASQLHRRSTRIFVSILLVQVIIPVGVFFVYYAHPPNVYYAALLLPSSYSYVTLSELLFVVVLNDFLVKLVTVWLKIFAALLHTRNCGRQLALLEYVSETYRSLSPIQPWFSFLIDNYTGLSKIFGVVLAAFYAVCKGPDVIHKVKNCRLAFNRLTNSQLGKKPSKSELEETGGSTCPICQDNFEFPTMLGCKHIFCEQCVARWFDRERTCPMCRMQVSDDPSYKDGSTTLAIQFF